MKEETPPCQGCCLRARSSGALVGCWGTRCDETACPSGSGPWPGQLKRLHRIGARSWFQGGVGYMMGQPQLHTKRGHLQTELQGWRGVFYPALSWLGFVCSSSLRQQGFPLLHPLLPPHVPTHPTHISPPPPSLPRSTLPSAPALQLLHHPEMWGRLHSCAKRSERVSCSPLAWFPPASPSCPPIPAPASCPLMCLRSFAPGQEPPARWR